MSVTHLATLEGTLCGSHAARPVTTGGTDLVTCKRCSRRLGTLNADGWSAVRERQRAVRQEARMTHDPAAALYEVVILAVLAYLMLWACWAGLSLWIERRR